MMQDRRRGDTSFLIGCFAALATMVAGTFYSIIMMLSFPYPGKDAGVGIGGVLMSLLFVVMVYATYESVARVLLQAQERGLGRPLARSILVAVFMFGAYVASAITMYSYNCGMEGLLLSCPSLVYVQLFMRVVSVVMIIGMAWLVYVVLWVAKPDKTSKTTTRK